MSEELVQGSEFTTVTEYDPKVKAQAYEMFLNTDLCITDIALDLGVSQKVIAGWSRQGNWRARKEEIEVELFRSAEDKYRAVIIKHRVPTIERHLRVSGKLEDSIEKVIDHECEKDEPNSMTLKRMAEALASSAGVSARAAAINEKPFSEANKDEKVGKTPLIMINVNPSVSPDRCVNVTEV